MRFKSWDRWEAGKFHPGVWDISKDKLSRKNSAELFGILWSWSWICPWRRRRNFLVWKGFLVPGGMGGVSPKSSLTNGSVLGELLRDVGNTVELTFS